MASAALVLPNLVVFYSTRLYWNVESFAFLFPRIKAYKFFIFFLFQRKRLLRLVPRQGQIRRPRPEGHRPQLQATNRRRHSDNDKRRSDRQSVNFRLRFRNFVSQFKINKYDVLIDRVLTSD